MAESSDDFSSEDEGGRLVWTQMAQDRARRLGLACKMAPAGYSESEESGQESEGRSTASRTSAPARSRADSMSSSDEDARGAASMSASARAAFTRAPGSHYAATKRPRAASSSPETDDSRRRPAAPARVASHISHFTRMTEGNKTASVAAAPPGNAVKEQALKSTNLKRAQPRHKSFLDSSSSEEEEETSDHMSAVPTVDTATARAALQRSQSSISSEHASSESEREEVALELTAAEARNSKATDRNSAATHQSSAAPFLSPSPRAAPSDLPKPRRDRKSNQLAPFPVASPFEREVTDNHTATTAASSSSSSSSSSAANALSIQEASAPVVDGSDSDDGFWSDVPTTTVLPATTVPKNKKKAGKASQTGSKSSSSGQKRASASHAQVMEARALSHDQQRRAEALSRGALLSGRLDEASLLALLGVAPPSGAGPDDRRGGRIKVTDPMAVASHQGVVPPACRRGGGGSSKRRVSEAGFLSGSDDSDVGGRGRGSNEDQNGQDALFPDFGSGQGAPFYDPSARALPLAATVERAHLGAGASGARGHARGALGAPGALIEGEVPRSINRYLQGYQREGVAFLWKIRAQGGGGILADDMGLGKTVMVISLLAAHFHKTGTDADRLHLRQKRRRGLSSRRGGSSTTSSNRGYPSPDHGSVLPEARGDAVVVCAPASVLANWARELKKWGFFGVGCLSTNQTPDERQSMIADALAGRLEVLLIGHSLLSTFQTVLRSESVSASSSSKHLFGGLVVDECHAMTNPASQRTRACAALAAQCKFRIGLSGTPMSNKHMELFNLLNMLHPGCLGDWPAFNEFYSRPIKRGQTKTADRDAVKLGRKRSAELVQALLPLMLRRTKQEQLANELPDKFDRIVFCALTPLQAELYAACLKLPDFENVRLAGELCPCGSGHTRGKCCFKAPYLVAGSKGHLDDTTVDPRALIWHQLHPEGQECPRCPHCVAFPCLAKLQKVANHPTLLLVDPVRDFSDPLRKQRTEAFARAIFSPSMLAQLRSGANGGGSSGSGGGSSGGRSDSQATLPIDASFSSTGGINSGGSSSSSNSSSSVVAEGANPYVRSENFWDLSNPAHCGKLGVLAKLLSLFRKTNEKVLVFSWSTQTLDVLGAFCQAHGWPFTRLDGSTPTKTRQHLVDSFNASVSSFVFLCSTKAGGVGINLQSASKVIIFDVNWNPSFDQQAQDRAYRIGQTKDVSVFRLVCQGTIEELMYMRQLYKTGHANSVLDGKHSERMFDAIEGERKGELYGLANLMRFDYHGHLARLRTDAGHDDTTNNKVMPALQPASIASSSSSSSSSSPPTSSSSSANALPSAQAAAEAGSDCENEGGTTARGGGAADGNLLKLGLDVRTKGDLFQEVLEAAEAPPEGEGQGSSVAHELLGLEGARSCLNGDFLDSKKKPDGDEYDGFFSSEEEDVEPGDLASDKNLGSGDGGDGITAAAATAAAKTTASATAVGTVLPASKPAEEASTVPAGRTLPFGKKTARGKEGKASNESKAPSKAQDSSSGGRGGGEQKAAAKPAALGFKLFVPSYIKK